MSDAKIVGRDDRMQVGEKRLGLSAANVIFATPVKDIHNQMP